MGKQLVNFITCIYNWIKMNKIQVMLDFLRYLTNIIPELCPLIMCQMVFLLVSSHYIKFLIYICLRI